MAYTTTMTNAADPLELKIALLEARKRELEQQRAADAIFCNGQSDSTCSSRVRDGMLGGGIATAAVLYIGGMAAVTAQAARQKKSFLAAQKEEGK